MSKKNGDKARFRKEIKKKLMRRQRNLALRNSLLEGATTLLPATEVAASTSPGTATDTATKVTTDKAQSRERMQSLHQAP